MKIALILTNYNMPERTNALVSAVMRRSVWPMDYYVVDNGSDLVNPSTFTSIKLQHNCQTTGAWLAGLRAARESGKRYLAYWFLITSAEFPADNSDPLYPLASFLVDNPSAVGVHPALTQDSTTHWEHMIDTGTRAPRRTWMIDNIAALYRADWFDSIGWFDERLTYAWGVDLETSYLARQAGRELWIDERVRVKKVTDIGYTMGRMNMSADERREKATRNMEDVLSEKYGPAWRDKLYKEQVYESI